MMIYDYIQMSVCSQLHRKSLFFYIFSSVATGFVEPCVMIRQPVVGRAKPRYGEFLVRHQGPRDEVALQVSNH